MRFWYSFSCRNLRYSHAQSLDVDEDVHDEQQNIISWLLEFVLLRNMNIFDSIFSTYIVLVLQATYENYL